MFRLISTDDGRELPFEYMPASAITPKYGMALYLTSGKLAVASVANRAEYMCCREGDAALTAGDIIPVVKIQEDQVWETTSSDTPTVGVGMDVASGGLTVATKNGSTGIGNFIPEAVTDTGAIRGRFKTTA